MEDIAPPTATMTHEGCELALMCMPEALDTGAHHAYTARYPSLSIQSNNSTYRRNSDV